MLTADSPKIKLEQLQLWSYLHHLYHLTTYQYNWGSKSFPIGTKQSLSWTDPMTALTCEVVQWIQEAGTVISSLVSSSQSRKTWTLVQGGLSVQCMLALSASLWGARGPQRPSLMSKAKATGCRDEYWQVGKDGTRNNAFSWQKTICLLRVISVPDS